MTCLDPTSGDEGGRGYKRKHCITQDSRREQQPTTSEDKNTSSTYVHMLKICFKTTLCILYTASLSISWTNTEQNLTLALMKNWNYSSKLVGDGRVSNDIIHVFLNQY